MDPTIEKALKLPTKQKIMLLVLTLLLLSAGMYFALLKPKQAEYKELHDKLVGLQAQVEENEKVARNLPKLQKEYAQLNIELAAALSELPDKKEIPSLLTSITNAGKGAGLDFLMFKPRPEEPKDFYAAVPVDITVSGSYHNVAKFYAAVAAMPRIVNLSNVAFSDPKTAGGQTNLKITCLATTFRFLDKKEIKNDKKGK